MSATQNNVTGGKPAQVASATKPSGLSTKVRIDPAKLVPDLDTHRAAVTQSFWYWIGLTNACPVQAAFLGGECFPKTEELVSKDMHGATVRVPVFGAMVKLTREKFDRICEQMQRTVLRFDKADAGDKEEPGTGQNVGMPHRLPRKGYWIRIPTKHEVESRARSGMPVPSYAQGSNDEPGADYIYCVPAANQDQPVRGPYLPDPVSKTGMEWIGD